ncbi:DUF3427 domain-containing protein [Georgenia wutianyii]|uniref:DUF3427 domain-containing protein n=1 Tax=Georgenia wutianyii TaxID=2585135 RepID=A0ABX5VM70_9MICO|nr:DEAD/DEAH box helicase [Georgenia wutianyii]QDB79591.1 DUF3427 domain-containing protein [Georgenia wutianyii]
MHDGLYESLITTSLQQTLNSLPPHRVIDEQEVDEADAPSILARHVAEELERALRETKNAQTRLTLINDVLEHIEAAQASVQSPVRQLHAVRPKPQAHVAEVLHSRPRTPLSDAALLTNAKGDPNLGAELRSEFDSAEQVDLLCAFVKWSGLRVLEEPLRAFTARGGRLRVITTTYVGATERRALDRLVNDFGAQVKVQYEIARTRLHAKSWMFRRSTGFDTAYVGSSNLSTAALLDGVEWNVRLSAVATPALLHKFDATFETYWNDPSYIDYDPDRDGDRLDAALAAASGRKPSTSTLNLSGLEVRPFPHQVKILEQLDAERTVHDRHRNLVVAATGTGKTVVAALDYRNLAAGAPQEWRLLFVAHRIEILEQAQRTYREVLADGSFGELWGQGQRPQHGQHVFATIQSVTNELASIPPDAFDILVVDEFHHAHAASYRRLLDHFAPRELLGLTATPERTDGIDVSEAFFGGRTAAEMRLWDALEAELLSPFHYFAVSDNVDLRDVSWKRGRYDQAELENVYTGNDARARIILKELQDKVGDVSQMRALGFCVGVRHAEYMAQTFTAAGIPARAVSGGTPSDARAQALRDLRSREVNVLFTADLYNEGIDLPEVDTVLFLRPTESATIFLQQLGRGLRAAPTKAVLTALDFVGHQRREFRFDRKFRSLTGATRKGLREQIEKGFPFLPSGCQIVLDRQSQQIVLDGIKAQVQPRWAALVNELRSLKREHDDVSLATFLRETDAELADVLKPKRGWTQLRADAGLAIPERGPRHEELVRRATALAHVDDLERGAAYLAFLAEDAPDYDAVDELQQRYARMLFFSLWPDRGGFGSYAEGLAALRPERAARGELSEVINLGLDSITHVPAGIDGPLTRLGLRTHAHYSRDEIVAALDHASLERRADSFREGVLYSKPWNTDALFVTLKKSERDYSPTTMYNDYAISPRLFHWESQSRTTVASPTGQRYLNHRELGSHVLLLARARKVGPLGTAPYLLLGPADYVNHRGERPIAITWKLRRPLPMDFFQEASVASA